MKNEEIGHNEESESNEKSDSNEERKPNIELELTKKPVISIRGKLSRKKKPVLTEDWVIKKKYSKRLNQQELEFILRQAEKRLSQTHEVSNLIVSRATLILTTTSGILLLIVGYITKTLLTSNHFCVYNISLLICVIMAIYYFSIIFILSKNLRGHSYYSIGTKPTGFIKEYYFARKYDKKGLRFKEFHLAEIEDYQKRIIVNNEKNEKRWKENNLALNMLIFSPLVLLLISFFFLWYWRFL